MIVNKLNSFFCIVLSLMVAQTTLAQDNVLYGERSPQMNVDAVFFDQEGSIYPDFFISNESLMQSKAKIHTWYKDHPSEFKEIAKQVNCPVETLSTEHIQQLEDTLVKRAIRKIQGLKTASSTLNVLVHGYRKSFAQNEHDKQCNFHLHR